MVSNYDDELVVMSPICDGEIKPVYKPDPAKFIGDVDLEFSMRQGVGRYRRNEYQRQDLGVRIHFQNSTGG